MSRLLAVLVLVAVLVLGGRFALGEEETGGGRVARVVDGDTVHVRLGAGRATVRVLGIDTPEHGDCGYDEASDALRSLAQGRRVVLIADRTQAARDRYDRLLRYVELRRGRRDLGELLVRRGWARVYVFDRPFERVLRYRAAAEAAREERRGLHRECGGLP